MAQPFTPSAVALALLLAAVAVPAQTAPDTAQLERVRARIHALQEKLNGQRREKDAVREELERAERRIGDFRVQLRELEAEVERQLKQVRHTEQQELAAQQALERERDVLARQLRAAYLIGQRGKAKLLLNQDDAQRVSRTLTYYDFLNRRRGERITAMLRQVGELRELQNRLRRETDHLQSLRERELGALQALEATRLERREALRKLERAIRQDARQLARLQETERELGQLLGSLRDALADIPVQLDGPRPFAKSKGRLPWPLRGRLLASFGEAKLGHLKWNGLWIAAAEGEPVRAVARGRVAYVGWMHRYGLIIVLEHDGGYYTLYGHSQAVQTSVGEWVNAGDVIALAGNSGGHQQAGLYFELRAGTDPVNPKLWLAR